MTATDASRLLRPGLLDRVSVLVAGASTERSPGGLGHAVQAACAGLGARVSSIEAASEDSPERGEAEMDEAVTAALAALGQIDTLVIDAAGLLSRAPADHALLPRAPADGALLSLGACLQDAWTLTRSVFNLALLPGARGGRIVYLAPAPGAGGHSEPARAGLENLSRTLSIEWARHRVTAVTIAPGDGTPAGEVAALTAYLASAAGSYFSGCLLDLSGAGGDR
jgi:NAD(P)-dependent dehydrogenase (short-subunit alcohol dehydrogenase family)